MEIPLTPELEAQLQAAAITQGRTAAELAAEALAEKFSYNAWFTAEVQKGLDDLDQGRIVEDEEVHRQIARFLKPQ